MTDLTGDELVGGWLKLCGSLIGHAAESLGSTRLSPVSSKSGHIYRLEAALSRRVAAGWVNGAPAVVPFEEACEILGWSEDYARRAFDKYLQKRREKKAT